jgi:hypothetical protein
MSFSTHCAAAVAIQVIHRDTEPDEQTRPAARQGAAKIIRVAPGSVSFA